MIKGAKKAGFFSPIRIHAAIAKKWQNTGCLARLLGYSVFKRSMSSDLIRGWVPGRVKKTRQNKGEGFGADFN